MRALTLTTLILLLAGCAGRGARPDETALLELVLPTPEYADGSLYTVETGITLFEDLRARRVGDVLTVVLTERTDASKSASTTTAKDTSFNLEPLPLAGQTIDTTALDSGKEFEGTGNSVQNNRLTGSITVTVTQVLGNGLMRIQGQKWITINQGREYLSIQGLVRSQDVRADNSVFSTQIANARIGYSGTGALADANREGWLTRLFGSVLSPL